MAKRVLECNGCGHTWDTIAKPENVAAGKIRCKQCKSTDVKDAITEVQENDVCKRCGGDGFWRSTKTGVRAKTSAEPLVDKKRPCPECSG